MYDKNTNIDSFYIEELFLPFQKNSTYVTKMLK